MDNDAEKQQLYNQIHTIAMQKQTLIVQQKDLEDAIDSVTESDDDIFKAVGPVLIKSSKEKVLKELKEMQEDFELKLKTLESHEKKLQNMMKNTSEGSKAGS